MVRPKYFMPVHGEYRFLVSHSKLAEKQGIPKENVFILGDGSVLEITESGASVNGKVPSGRIFIDGKGIGDVEEMVLRDRRWLSQDGIVLVLITIEKPSGEIVVGPDIITRGFIYEESSQRILDEVRELVSTTIKDLDQEITSDQTLLQAQVRRVVKKYFKNTMERRPMIMPIIIEV